jgi:hypothetical protein
VIVCGRGNLTLTIIWKKKLKTFGYKKNIFGIGENDLLLF